MLRKMQVRFQMVLVGMVLLCGPAAQALTLVTDGKPAAAIVTDPKPTIAANLAALEVQYHIEAITGVKLPINPPGPAAQAPAAMIFVGESDATRKLGLKSADFKSQEYLIKIDDNSIILMGRDWLDTPANRAEAGKSTSETLQDSRETINYNLATGHQDQPPLMIQVPGLLDDQGTCYAAYDFLERFCGVRWYAPATFGTVIPQQQTLTIKPVTIRRTPSLLHRVAPGGGWPIIRKQWGNHKEDHKELFLRRIRYGGNRWGCNHAFSSYYDRFLNKESKLFERSEPNFFAVGYENEGSWRQLCYTNPDLVKQVAQDARDFFDGKGLKGTQVAVGDYFSIVPADTDHWCKCDRCQPILEKDKDRGQKGMFASGTASNYIFGFVNAVAKEVKQTHPDKYIAALAYWCYTDVPTFELESNVSVAPCLGICYAHTGNFRNEKPMYYRWVEESRRSGRPLYLWNYFHHPMERAILGKYKCFPNFMADVISDWVKRYARDGVKGFFLCGIPEQLDFSLYMQTAFDDRTELMTYTDEFFTGYFGAAAEPMKAFYWRIADIGRHERAISYSEEHAWEELGTEERMKELGELMARAVQLASTDLEKQRVESWRRGVWEYMDEGRRDYLAKQKSKDKDKDKSN